MASSRNVTVRMYNVGFGDAFLLLFPGADRPRKVLIDCGSHSIGPGPVKMKELVQRIIEDVTDGDGVPRIDVVVCTHRHQDHVSGFRYKFWNAVEVGEVWMPWTEDPEDEEAREIRERQSSRARALTFALARLGASASAQAIAKNCLTNAAAMHTLHKGFKVVRRRRYLPKKRSPRTFTTAELPGVAVHVLGPSRDRDVIRDMEPEKGESYLQFMLSRSDKPQQRLRPFRNQWALDEAEFRRDYPHLKVTAPQRRGIAEVGSGSELELAANLEKAVNGTSLMLMFVIGRAHLLFTGDAQWGTWTAALNDPEWAALLRKTTFYKVGHHASHNATPPAFVERHPTGRFAAMVSTRCVDMWPEIPRGPLLEALRKRSNRIIRSDQADVPDSSEVVRRPTCVEIPVPI
jgi:beta-lactamase superfamily II metal-dependent hydrolase